jgi:hypothetical protein
LVDGDLPRVVAQHGTIAALNFALDFAGPGFGVGL